MLAAQPCAAAYTRIESAGFRESGRRTRWLSGSSSEVPQLSGFAWRSWLGFGVSRRGYMSQIRANAPPASRRRRDPRRGRSLVNCPYTTDPNLRMDRHGFEEAEKA